MLRKANKFLYLNLLVSGLLLVFGISCTESPDAQLVDDELQDLDEFEIESQERRQLIRNVCRATPAQNPAELGNLGPDNERRVIKRMRWPQLYDEMDRLVTKAQFKQKWWRSHLHVNNKLKMVYCHIPKVASRNLLRFFVQLTEPWLSNEYVASLQVHTNRTGMQNIKHLSKFRANRGIEIMKKYKKVVFSRNPLERLLSAWWDKLYQSNSVFAKRHGRRIIRMYRKNATREEIDKGYPVFLPEFFRYIAFSDLPTWAFDSHWKPMHHVCFLCAIKYDFIGRLENIEAEIEFLGRSLINNATVPLPKLLSARPRLAIREDERYAELRKIPRSLVERVLSKYRLDYDIFGYNMTTDLNNIYGTPRKLFVPHRAFSEYLITPDAIKSFL